MRKVFDFICLDNDVFIRGRDDSERKHTNVTIMMMMLLMTVIMPRGWFYPKLLTRARVPSKCMFREFAFRFFCCSKLIIT